MATVSAINPTSICNPNTYLSKAKMATITADGTTYLFSSTMYGTNPGDTVCPSVLGFTVGQQTSNILTNLTTLLSAAGYGKSNVAHATIYLKNASDYNTVQALFIAYFTYAGQTGYPAFTYQVLSQFNCSPSSVLVGMFFVAGSTVQYNIDSTYWPCTNAGGFNQSAKINDFLVFVTNQCGYPTNVCSSGGTPNTVVANALTAEVDTIIGLLPNATAVPGRALKFEWFMEDGEIFLGAGMGSYVNQNFTTVPPRRLISSQSVVVPSTAGTPASKISMHGVFGRSYATNVFDVVTTVQISPGGTGQYPKRQVPYQVACCYYFAFTVTVMGYELNSSGIYSIPTNIQDEINNIMGHVNSILSDSRVVGSVDYKRIMRATLMATDANSLLTLEQTWASYMASVTVKPAVTTLLATSFVYNQTLYNQPVPRASVDMIILTTNPTSLSEVAEAAFAARDAAASVASQEDNAPPPIYDDITDTTDDFPLDESSEPAAKRTKL